MLGFKKRYVLLASFFLFCGLWFLLVSWPTFNEYPIYRYYNVSAKIEKNGKQYDVSGQIACNNPGWPFAVLGIGSFAISGGSSYVATSYAIGYKFEDGDGILLKPDGLNCTLHGYFSDIDENAVPMVYWMDNAEKPTLIEGYFLPEYYKRPDARLRVVEYNVDYGGSAFFYGQWGDDLGQKSEFEWLHTNEELSFSGVVATFAPAKRWRHIPKLEQMVARETSLTRYSFGAFPKEVSDPLWMLLLGGGNLGRARMTRPTYCVNKPDICESEDNTHGAVLRDGNLSIQQDAKTRGVLVFHPETWADQLKRVHDKTEKTVTLRIPGRTEEIRENIVGRVEAYYYVPSTKQFFQVAEKRISRHDFIGIEAIEGK